jgi:excisionase family DNA binding protein
MGTQLVTLGRAAEELQVSRDTLRRLAARGELKTIRTSRRVLVPTSEILRIVEGGVGKYAGQKPARDGRPK